MVILARCVEVHLVQLHRFGESSSSNCAQKFYPRCKTCRCSFVGIRCTILCRLVVTDWKIPKKLQILWENTQWKNNRGSRSKQGEEFQQSLPNKPVSCHGLQTSFLITLNNFWYQSFVADSENHGEKIPVTDKFFRPTS